MAAHDSPPEDRQREAAEAPGRMAAGTTQPPGRKSLTELLIIPVTLTIVTSLAGSFAVWINGNIQKAETERAFRASQINAVVKLPLTATAGDSRLYAPRLAAYGEYGIPLLTDILQSYPEAEQVAAAERGLIQVGVISSHSEAVGKAMRLILQDRWASYDHRVHESALRIISAVCYGQASLVLGSYEASAVVKDWDQVLASEKWLSHFNGVLATARQVATRCSGSKQGENAP
jgi:hypothetical protein